MTQVSDWVALDDSTSRRNASLPTAQLQQVQANINAALADRSRCAGSAANVLQPQWLHGAPVPLAWWCQVDVLPQEQTAVVELLVDCQVADVTLHVSIIRADGMAGQFDPQVVSPGTPGTPTLVQIEVPVDTYSGALRFAVVATSDDVGAGGSGAVAVASATVLDVQRTHYVVNFDPVAAGMNYTSQPYLLRWDTSAYPEGAVPVDVLVLGVEQIGATSDYRIHFWPPLPEEMRKAQAPYGGVPDWVGKTGAELIPIGWCELHSMQWRVTANSFDAFAPDLHLAGRAPSSGAARLAVASALDFYRGPAARLESIQHPTDLELLSAVTGGPVMPTGVVRDFFKSVQTTYQTLGACYVGAQDGQEDAAAAVTWRRTYIVRGLIGMLGMVEGDEIRVRLKATLEDAQTGGTVVTVETDDTTDPTFSVLTTHSHPDGVSNIGALMIWSGTAAVYWTPLEWHCARGLLPYGERGATGMAAARLYPFEMVIQEDSGEVGTTAQRLLRVQVKAASTATRNSPTYIWSPTMCVTVAPGGV